MPDALWALHVVCTQAGRAAEQSRAKAGAKEAKKQVSGCRRRNVTGGVIATPKLICVVGGGSIMTSKTQCMVVLRHALRLDEVDHKFVTSSEACWDPPLAPAGFEQVQCLSVAHQAA